MILVYLRNLDPSHSGAIGSPCQKDHQEDHLGNKTGIGPGSQRSNEPY